MPSRVKNIFKNVSCGSDGETFETIFDQSNFRIERIVSHSHATPEGSWYDQAGDEWVMILRGDATLEFENGELVELDEGDYLMIPRRTKHRVSRTAATTVWLAIHLQ